MLEKLIYKNSMNETLSFGQDGIFVNSNDLRDYKWNVTSKNNRISGFDKGVTTKSLPVVIMCNSEEEGIEIRNKLFEVCEKDVLLEQHGRIIIGDYYMKCYINGSKKAEYLKSKRYMKTTLTVTTDFPYWVKETMATFGYGVGSQGGNLDFNNDFPYDYTSTLLSKTLNNANFVPSNFIMRIYGPCENPRVTIEGHDYEVTKTLEANENITIDSIAKTIVLTHANGRTENCFNLRNKNSYIFEKMPVGISSVSNNSDFKFDITLLEERSEPKWT